MREPLKDRIRLEHIVASADNISRYTYGKTYNDLLSDDMNTQIPNGMTS